MGDIVTLTIADRIAHIVVDSPPLNVLGHAVRQEVFTRIQQAQASDNADILILSCAGRSFFAGADISEFGKPIAPPELHDIIALIETGTKPLIAAIHGTALGGGCEVALACDYRVAVPSAKLGLPEINLGLMPGAGGTQRLPRLVGAEAALRMIVTGKPVSAIQAAEMGLVDIVARESELTEGVRAYARQILKAGKGRRLARHSQGKVEADRDAQDLIDAFVRDNARLFNGSVAAESIVESVRASVERGFDEALATETRLFDALYKSPEVAARRHLFFAERATSRIPGLPADVSVSPVHSVGIVGAGTMGGGIAMNFLDRGIAVTIIDTSRDGLDRGISAIRRNYENSVRRGTLTQDALDKNMALLAGALDLEVLSSADLIIEAVYESMDVKKEVFKQLDAIAKPGAIFATNTSFLDIDEIARATSRPEQVLGLHFFSPANVMRLLEVVRGVRTADNVLATAMVLAKTIRKIPVLSGVCDGFIANRAMAPRWHEADRLIMEGVTPTDVDRVLTEYGFAMGHFAMMDLVGLDVIGRDSAERSVMGDLVAAGRLGLKSGKGYYDYDEKRRAISSSEVQQIITRFAGDSAKRRQPIRDDEILKRLLYPVINEAAKILEEGIALRASDIDVALVTGYGWPAQTGGPTFWADTVGLAQIVKDLEMLAVKYGDIFTPAPLLRKLAEEQRGFRGMMLVQ